jgi:hypothetical protein
MALPQTRPTPFDPRVALLVSSGRKARMRDVGVLDIMEAPALLAYIAGEYEPGPD